MIERLLPARAESFYRRDLPEPLYVPNLLTFDSESHYRWYGRLAYPLLKLVGGDLKWSGTHSVSYTGPTQCEEFLLVEYPTHRRLLLLRFNPLYPLANYFRETAVEYFEAGFTYSDQHPLSLWEHEHLLIVHATGEDDADVSKEVRELFAETTATFAYDTRQVAPFEFHPGPEAGSDPHPLEFDRLVCFGVEDRDQADEVVSSVTDDLDERLEEYSLQLYERERRR
jgi:hypothetical protein